MTPEQIELKMTCGACPEQYDAFVKGQQVAYLRLRHGCFTVECPGVLDELVYYSEDMKGDGAFDDDERDFFLGIAKEHIARYYNTHGYNHLHP